MKIKTRVINCRLAFISGTYLKPFIKDIRDQIIQVRIG